ncbi:UDP-glucose:glyco protein glucosyltransferas-like protein [Pseudovirgaria hyperparasitica]|uniref:UDP-glucose:glyco protein glucosyltransferas-like protein n=1 Tax=Pseudovirgaria hyperparasitica TaxID=470096 RepID=A0A6A6WBC6_9PEZI|nr:UDP-glucose:glyco protein glucosyltransferas-like protein [Pseudovirgaria hyperparasitica]KAF2759983.1 UDP-glucose:glyco protein glucosyltransferas-like protein [Pseudovirgaria hyperparasitica]
MKAHTWALSTRTAFLASSILVPTSTLAQTPPVNVALRAAFGSPPYLVELLETAAEENVTAYFPILDRIADGYFNTVQTDEELYTRFLGLLEVDGHITEPEALSSFQLALSIRSEAPRIEAHYQYYNTSAEPSVPGADGQKCEAWVAFGGKQYCSPSLDSPKTSLVSSGSAQLPFDRILGDPLNALSSILYVDITSEIFSQFHKTLSATARQGKTSYRIRHKPPSGISRPLLVSGYGVELALKRTDYIVIDDRQEGRSDGLGAAKVNIEADSLLEGTHEIRDVKPLSKSELESLGINAASFVLGSKDPLDTLLKLSQDFPKHSSAISAHNASQEFVQEWKGNRDLALPAGYNVIWINGIQVDPRKVDPFSLLDHLRRERKLINGVRRLGFSGPEAIKLLSHSEVAQTHGEDDPQRYDFRDANEGGKVLLWLNNIEKDKRYEDWPTQLTTLLQRMYPGQLPPLRRDLHNSIVPIDFSASKDISLVLETLRGLIQRKIPVQWGLVPLTTTSASAEQARVVYHLLETYGLKTMLSYLEMVVSSKSYGSADKSAFLSSIEGVNIRKDQTALTFEELLVDEELSKRLESARGYTNRLAISGPESVVFVNGVPVTMDDDWLQNLSSRIGLDFRKIQRGVFEKVFTDDSWLPEIFLFQAALNRNPLIIPKDESSVRLFDVGKIWEDHGEFLTGAPRIAVEDNAAKENWAQMIVIADFDSVDGRRLLSQSSQYRLRESNTSVETIYVHNPSAGSSDEPHWSRGLLVLNKDGRSLRPIELTDSFAGDLNEVSKEDAQRFWTKAQPLVKLTGLQPGEQGVLVNGRLVGPLPEGTAFLKADFETMMDYEVKKRIGPAVAAISKLDLIDRIKTPSDAAKLSSILALSSKSDVPEGMFETSNTVRTSIFDKFNSTHSAIVNGDEAKATVQLVASIDPASEVAQRWIPMIKVLSELDGIHLRIFMNPKPSLSELPIKRFYRYVLESKPMFEVDGSVSGLRASFSGIPAEALLTMGMDVAASWLVAPEESIHDLDNIKLSSLGQLASIDALYKLEHILIEGHSRDLTTTVAPRGAQLVLGTAKDAQIADTLIMANLGYFQFKAVPGFYSISLQSGRSQEVFKLESAGTKGYNPQAGDETPEIALMSFQGATLYPRFSRNPGMEEEDVLSGPSSFAADLADTAGEVVDTLLSKVGLSGSKLISQGLKGLSDLVSHNGLSPGKASKHAEINIFSVASGHLYERMLNIMMLSVMKHTSHTVKFWFIEQFLSPSFKSFLPNMAAEYGFEYEMVTYKWPHWLRGQKEKQREIWGYKILFLDVLFPLDLDKVIFVDADQIVRTDMYELVKHDLQGAPYGFTPMCDSRTEMEGYRFWKVGYWKSFLRGLPYHISALYVVDLKQFRQMAAGDRLRQQYHQLSADPNSLSNLDQDLPNNMQTMLPIHSLPQEWLWCETWCSDASLKEAKTIDLCNNPETKEPKLDRARRQVPEWTVYDDEIAALAKRVQGERVTLKSEQELENEREFIEKAAERKRDEL